MNELLREVTEITGAIRVDNWRALEPGSVVTGAPRLPGVQAMLVVARGQGRARLRVDGRDVGDTDTATTFARVVDGRLLAYAAFEAVPTEFELTLDTTEGETLNVTVIQITQRGSWLARRLRSAIPCHLCMRLVRAAITALLAAAGVPDIGLGDEILDAIADWLPDASDLPEALNRVLDWLFGGDYDGFLGMLRRFIDNLPFNKIARAICEYFGFC